MRAIGGFFEAERDLSGTEGCHPNALALSSGRGAFRVILEQIRPRNVFVPFYICDSLLQPLRLLGIPFIFYALDEGLCPAEAFDASSGDYVLAVNYFGLQTNRVLSLVHKWGSRIIIDNTQAFFEGPVSGCFSFNSARKFFGVPDGSFLYTPEPFPLELRENDGVTFDHLKMRAMGRLQEAYEAFREAEARITCDRLAMCRYSFDTLQHIRHERVCARRRANYAQYENAFAAVNQLHIALAPKAVPFCYPLWPRYPIERKLLSERGVFVPTFWPDILTREQAGFSFERRLTRELLPLPVDHRYGSVEIETVIQMIRASTGAAFAAS